MVKVKYNPEKKDFEVLPLHSKEGFYLDGLLKSNLDIVKEVIKKDFDMVFVVDGNEGSGKSTIASQIAYYCDPTFNLDKMTFSPKEFKEAVLNAKKYEAIVYDEAYGGLNSRATMSRINRTIVRMLTEIRARNLFIIIVLPCFFDLDKYVALWRSRILINVYLKGKYDRGQFKFFNTETKKALYMLGKKYYSYSKPSANFYGTFTSFFPLDKEEYSKKKKLATKTEEQEAKEIFMIAKEIRRDITNNLEVSDLTNVQKATVLGVTDRTIYKYLNELKESSA
jgi:ABC-type dipeptide/oligopeptide/nickel transport system ATPase subunit